MLKEKIEILKEVSRFVDYLIRFGDDTRVEVRRTISSFQMNLADYNLDPRNKESRPFFLINKDLTRKISSQTTLKILAMASDIDLHKNFIKVDGSGNELLFFGHDAVEFIDTILDKFDLRYTNIMSNGIVFNEVNLIGFYSAPKERLSKGLEDINHVLNLSLH